MRFYDHQHMTGLHVRRLLDPPAAPWRPVLEFVALAGSLAVLVLLLQLLA